MNTSKTQRKKLSLNEFIAKTGSDKEQDLSRISGGILGACHVCVTYQAECIRVIVCYESE